VHIAIIRTYTLNTFGNVLHAGTQEAAGDIEIDQLRQRLVETEAAMERIVVQMGNISRSVKHNASSQPEIKVYQINFDAIHSFSLLVVREMCTSLCSDCVTSLIHPMYIKHVVHLV